MEDILIHRIQKEFRSRDYSTLNLIKNPFRPLTVWSTNVPPMIGRKQELDEFSRYLIDMLNDQLDSVAILGYKGIGKTHLLLHIFNLLTKLLKSSDEIAGRMKLQLVRTNGEFIDFYSSIKSSIQKIKVVLLLDDAEQIWYRYPNELKSLYDSPSVKVVATWNAYAWKTLKKEKLALPRSSTIMLKKLSFSDCENIIKSRIRSTAINKNKDVFTAGAIRLLADVSDGVPYTLTTLAEKCLQKAIAVKGDVVDEAIAITVTKELGFFSRNIEKSFQDLTKTQRFLLRKLWEMTTSFKRGITASELATEIGVSRPAVLPHMKKLVKASLITDERLGREVRFFVNPDMLEYIEKYFEVGTGDLAI